jgi:hypothetical protein
MVRNNNNTGITINFVQHSTDDFVLQNKHILRSFHCVLGWGGRDGKGADPDKYKCNTVLFSAEFYVHTNITTCCMTHSPHLIHKV